MARKNTNSKPNSYYENACYGHQCDTYKLAYALQEEVERIYHNWDRTKQVFFPYIKFLRLLVIQNVTILLEQKGALKILPSTIDHWKTCRPANLRIMEQVKLFCDETMVDYFSDTPRLVFEYFRLTQPPTRIDTTSTKSFHYEP